MLSTRHAPQNKISAQTKTEGNEKILHAKGHGKKKLGQQTYIKQNRFQNKGPEKKTKKDNTLYLREQSINKI